MPHDYTHLRIKYLHVLVDIFFSGGVGLDQNKLNEEISKELSKLSMLAFLNVLFNNCEQSQ